MTFNKFSVALTIINMMWLPIVCVMLRSFPPTSFMICWTAFWTAEAFFNMKIHENKKKRDSHNSVIAELEKHITKDNVADVIERVIRKVE